MLSPHLPLCTSLCLLLYMYIFLRFRQLALSFLYLHVFFHIRVYIPSIITYIGSLFNPFPLLVQSFCFIAFMYLFHPRACIPPPTFICLFISLASRLSLFLPSSTRHSFFQSLFNRSVLLFLCLLFLCLCLYSIALHHLSICLLFISLVSLTASLHPSSFPSSPLPVYPPFTAPVRPASFQCTPLFHLSLPPSLSVPHPIFPMLTFTWLSTSLSSLSASLHYPSILPLYIFTCLSTSLLSLSAFLHVHLYLPIPLLCIPLCLPVLHYSYSYPSPSHPSPPLSVPHPSHAHIYLSIHLPFIPHRLPVLHPSRANTPSTRSLTLPLPSPTYIYSSFSSPFHLFIPVSVAGVSRFSVGGARGGAGCLFVLVSSTSPLFPPPPLRYTCPPVQVM